jgi:hypothetical protein
MIVDATLQRDRAGRLVQQAVHEQSALTLAETIDSLTASWRAPTHRPNVSDGLSASKAAALERVGQRAVADRLLALAADSSASPDAKAIAELEIGQLRRAAEAASRSAVGAPARAHWLAIAGDFARWQDRRELPKPTPALVAPPGDPFGIGP